MDRNRTYDAQTHVCRALDRCDVERPEKRGQEWKIANRQFMVEWSHYEISSAIRDEGALQTLTLRGERGHGDLAFQNRL